jgi:hypothetical protein
MVNPHVCEDFAPDFVVWQEILLIVRIFDVNAVVWVQSA